MIDIYYTYEKVNTDEFTKKILARHYGIRNANLQRTFNGKPYLPNGKIYFNLTHSKEITALAVGKSEVGLDCESLDGKPRTVILKKLSEREQAQIHSLADFYTHWTARESFIKYLGESLAACWRRVEILNGDVYFRGEKQAVKLLPFTVDNYTFCVCGNYTKYALHKIE